MMDPRMVNLADLLIEHSVTLKAGEHVLIEAFDVPEAMVIATIEAARRAGGHAHVALRSNRILRALYRDAGEDNFKVWPGCARVYVAMRHVVNNFQGCYVLIWSCQIHPHLFLSSQL